MNAAVFHFYESNEHKFQKGRIQINRGKAAYLKGPEDMRSWYEKIMVFFKGIFEKEEPPSAYGGQGTVWTEEKGLHYIDDF